MLIITAISIITHTTNNIISITNLIINVLIVIHVVYPQENDFTVTTAPPKAAPPHHILQDQGAKKDSEDAAGVNTDPVVITPQPKKKPRAAREQAATSRPSADMVPEWTRPATEPAASVGIGRRGDDDDGGAADRRPEDRDRDRSTGLRSQDRARSRSRSRRDKRGEWDSREWQEWSSRDWSNRNWQDSDVDDREWTVASGNRRSSWDDVPDSDDNDTEPKEPDRKPWESRDVGLDLQAWDEVVEQFNLDENAKQSLYLLSQHSRSGYQRANQIVGKLIRKAAARDYMPNPSGFVNKCVINARDEMQQEPHPHR